jgi:hypothetical protein
MQPNSRINGTNGTNATQKLSIHTAIASKKSSFIVRNQSETVGTNGTNGDKWRTDGKAICPDNREDKWGVGL